MSEPSEHRDVEDGSGKEKTRRGGKISEALEELTKNCQEKLNRDMMIFRHNPRGFRKKEFMQLYLASECGFVEDVKVLIEAGVDINNVSYKSPSTCLMIALDRGHVDIAKVLIDNGADINAPDWAGYPIYFAVQSRRVECVKLLIQAGIDVNLSRRSTR